MLLFPVQSMSICEEQRASKARTKGEYRQITQVEEFWRKGLDFVVCQKYHKTLGAGAGGGGALCKERSM
jgi:hypothetical protein